MEPAPGFCSDPTKLPTKRRGCSHYGKLVVFEKFNSPCGRTAPQGESCAPRQAHHTLAAVGARLAPCASEWGAHTSACALAFCSRCKAVLIRLTPGPVGIIAVAFAREQWWNWSSIGATVATATRARRNWRALARALAQAARKPCAAVPWPAPQPAKVPTRSVAGRECGGEAEGSPLGFNAAPTLCHPTTTSSQAPAPLAHLAAFLGAMGGEGVPLAALRPPAVPETEAGGTGGGMTAEALEKPKPDPWKLEPQPIREDQVENAVKFLSHPKVRTSPIVHRRSFLEKKGLTGEEIDEAFRRVPDPPSSEIAATALSSKGVPSSQPIAPAQSSGAGQALVARKPTELSWGQKLLGLGAFVVAGAGAGVITKAYLLPKFKSWVRSVLAEESETDKKVSPPSPAPSAEPPVNEAALAANAAAAAASEVAAAMREFSQSRVKESLQLGSIIKALETQTQELKSALSGMRDVVNNAESAPTTFGRGFRQDPWRTPEMPRPSGMLSDRSYAGAVTAPPSSERIESAENGTESGVAE